MGTRWAAALIVLGVSIPAWAIDTEGNYITRGIGTEVCSSYNSARDEHRDTEFTGWLAGYLSGFNRWTSGVYDIEGTGGFEGARQWLDYYCHVHPQLPFSLAVEALVAFLYPSRAQNAPAPGAAARGPSFGSSSPPP